MTKKASNPKPHNFKKPPPPNAPPPKKTGAKKGNQNARKFDEELKAVNLRLPVSELELFKADARMLGIYFNQWILEACRAKLNRD